MALKSSNKVDTNRYQLEVEIDGETFEKAVDQAYHKQNKKIVIPGFRKGKAPRAFVEKYYGQEVFYEDAINALYPDALEEAVNEAKLDMIEDKIDFDLVSAGKDGLVFKATITTKPEVQIEGYKGIEAKKAKVAVTDEAVDAEIAKVQDRNSRMVTVEDRAAQNGDIAVIDFEGFVDDVAFEGGKAENFSLTLGSGQFIPGFEEGVVGHKVGESFDVNVTFPTEYHSEELAGKDATFKVTIKELKRKELPTLDDEFAKDVSEFDTLEELKKDLTEKMAAEKKDQADSKMENDLLEQAVKNMTVEIPTVMFENKAQDMVEEFGYRLQTQGMNMDMYMKYTGTTPEALTAQFMPQAEAQVRTTLLLEKIAEVENIEITEEDINGEYDRMVKDYGMELDKVKSIVPVEEIKRQLTIQKAAKVITDSAVVTQL